MEIDLRTLEQGQTHLELELAPSSLAISPEDVTIEGPLRVALELDRRGDEIWVRGHLHALTPQQCSRCLTDFSQILELDFEVFCAKVQNPYVEGHPALSEEDGGVHPHDGRVLSLDGEIREAVILGLPMRPLCKESCAGLCPRCGEDRNLGPCRCEREAAPANT
ncbi:MAG: YceD family protein [Hyphomicrobiales bacterium]